MEKILETPRLLFREMHMGDVENLMMIFSDPIAMKFYPEVKNEEETIRWIVWTLNNYRRFGVGMWVVENKITGDFLGQCGLVPQKVDERVEMEIGYLFVKKEWGKGYATEAAKACRDYGLYTLRVEKMVSLIDPQNNSSLKVATRIGMSREKIIKKRGRDLFLYVLTRKECDAL
ncbi:GNAT family N-acetyltransferase [Aquibacillus rhizosphaerae]|uniref:GNAT family N-acetyltransferase n=1 Tax=Aquibacillus rhizosphaerae TaxID=3051431 RepID=A0ABT7L7I5_9BACI|nr:GNAT family N-acetyltransferase [Aquibacillus sp. LR5S19]MDL4841815.1 GNAT family N-acetyltransferase [Aquibacillus sp. LR5S19]